MQDVVRDGMKAGALGLSVSRNKGHYDPQGVHIPALWADEKEIFALGDVLREHGHRHHPVGRRPRRRDEGRLMARLSRGDRPHRRLQQSRPDDAPARRSGRSTWRGSSDDRASGIRAYPDVHARTASPDYFTMRNTQVFRGLPTWHPILPVVATRRSCKAYADPEVRAEAARGGGRVQGRTRRSASRSDLVELHVGADRRCSKRTSG